MSARRDVLARHPFLLCVACPTAICPHPLARTKLELLSRFKRAGLDRSKGENMIGAIGPLRVCLIALWFALLLPAPAQAQGKWVKLAPFPEPAEELLGAAAGGKIYVFCGLGPGWKPLGMVYEYDPSTD